MRNNKGISRIVSAVLGMLLIISVLGITPERIYAATIPKSYECMWYQVGGNYVLDIYSVSSSEIAFTIYDGSVSSDYIMRDCPMKVVSSKKAKDPYGNLVFNWKSKTKMKVTGNSYGDDLAGTYKKLATPKLGKWKNTTNRNSDGLEYTISWSKVANASGYHVIFYAKNSQNVWETWAEDIKSTSVSFEFSDDISAVKVKVYAYKNVKGIQALGKGKTSAVQKWGK